MNDFRPGLNPTRLVSLMKEAIKRCDLDLSNSVVLTEAASGAYAVTPVLAAMAGARHVFALTRTTRFGTVENIAAHTINLASLAGVGSLIEIVTEKAPEIIAQSDIITNSGHVRPIDNGIVNWMKPSAVIPLMYEAWEFRPSDLDLAACRHRGIKIGGTNERHPAVDVFSFLGIMAVKLLNDAGISVYGSSILLLCDNPFGPFIEHGLANAGACVRTYQTLSGVPESVIYYDAIVIALRPRGEPVLSAGDAFTIGDRWPGAVVAQFWGDLDRNILLTAQVPLWPPQAPAPGHIGVPPFRCRAGTDRAFAEWRSKVAELLLNKSKEISQRDSEFVQVVDMEDVNG